MILVNFIIKQDVTLSSLPNVSVVAKNFRTSLQIFIKTGMDIVTYILTFYRKGPLVQFGRNSDAADGQCEVTAFFTFTFYTHDE